MPKTNDGYVTLRVRQEVKDQLVNAQQELEAALGREVTNTDVLAFLLSANIKDTEDFRRFIEKAKLEWMFVADPARQHLHEHIDLLLDYYPIEELDAVIVRHLYTRTVDTDVASIRDAVDLCARIKRREGRKD